VGQNKKTKTSVNEIIPSRCIVSNPEIESEIIRLFNAHWPGVNITRGKLWNPSPNPISLNKSTLLTINPDNYMIANKTDGVRYAMILLTNPVDGQKLALMMDRSLKIYEISVCASKEYFSGTILDGELIYDDIVDNGQTRKQLTCYFFDVVSVAGISVTNHNLVERRKHIAKIIDLDYGILQTGVYQEKKQKAIELASQGKIVPLFNSHEELMFKTKRMWYAKDIERALSVEVSHKSDGLIFTPINEPVRNNTHWTCYKWKTSHTLDLHTTLSSKDSGYKCKLSFGDDRDLREKVVELPLFNACKGFVYHDELKRATTSLANLMSGKQTLEKPEPNQFNEYSLVYLVPNVNSKMFVDLISGLMHSDNQQPVNFIGEFELEWMSDENRIAKYLQYVESSVADSQNVGLNKLVIECKLVRVRTDKNVPNNFRTVQQTILNLKEGITGHDLMNQLTSK
jgi:hypothetical protein